MKEITLKIVTKKTIDFPMTKQEIMQFPLYDTDQMVFEERLLVIKYEPANTLGFDDSGFVDLVKKIYKRELNAHSVEVVERGKYRVKLKTNIMENKNNELVDFIKDIIISGMNLKHTSQVDGLIEKYMQRGVKLFSIPDVSDWVSPSEKLPKQHQKITVLGEGVYHMENDKVVMNTGEWYVDIEDFKAWKPCG